MMKLTITVAALALGQAPSGTGSIIVTVNGVKSSDGQIGCALFAAPGGFPLKPAAAVMRWQPARAGSVVCRYDDLRAGRYAVSVSHDLNRNRKTDTNFLGIPREDWGVSNNVRPSMRAPRFTEAAFAVAAGAPTRISVEIGR